jgi:glucokinase
MEFRLGIDLGATSAKIALVSGVSRIVQEGSVPTAGFPKPAELARSMAEVCRKLAATRRVKKVGVGVAGDIDSAHGIVRIGPNLGWKNVPLKKLLQARLKWPVDVENDAKAAAWGLYKTQIPARIKHLIVMTLGTGVGGGIIIDGKLHRGATGSAGEVGHMNIDENGPLCNCGLRGCLETYVGGPHIVKRVRGDLERGQKSALRAVFDADPDDLSPLVIAQAAQKGDAYALSVWRDVGHALGVAVGDLIYLLNPEMICFTGGIAQAKSLFLKPLREKLRERTFTTPINAVQLSVAAQAAHIGVVGAALL